MSQTILDFRLPCASTRSGYLQKSLTPLPKLAAEASIDFGLIPPINLLPCTQLGIIEQFLDSEMKH